MKLLLWFQHSGKIWLQTASTSDWGSTPAKDRPTRSAVILSQP